jgi:hypothetical protein
MTCEDARELLTALAAAPSGTSATHEEEVPAELVDHLVACANCLEELAVVETVANGKMSTLLNSIYAIEGCTLAAQQMPEWAARAAVGERPAPLRNPGWRHMDQCARCQTEYAELIELLNGAEAAAVDQPAAASAVEPLNNDLAAFFTRLATGESAASLRSGAGMSPARTVEAKAVVYVPADAINPPAAVLAVLARQFPLEHAIADGEVEPGRSRAERLLAGWKPGARDEARDDGAGAPPFVNRHDTKTAFNQDFGSTAQPVSLQHELLENADPGKPSRQVSAESAARLSRSSSSE